MKTHDRWDLRCQFFEAELARTRYGYAMTPFPNLGGLDLAGLFMQPKKFLEGNLYFSEFSPHFVLFMVILLKVQFFPSVFDDHDTFSR